MQCTGLNSTRHGCRSQVVLCPLGVSLLSLVYLHLLKISINYVKHGDLSLGHGYISEVSSVRHFLNRA